MVSPDETNRAPTAAGCTGSVANRGTGMYSVRAFSVRRQQIVKWLSAKSVPLQHAALS